MKREYGSFEGSSIRAANIVLYQRQLKPVSDALPCEHVLSLLKQLEFEFLLNLSTMQTF